ncbi:MAG TPA: putative Ig domain-containing protein, partial [Azospirillaceae bacterium]|nr:putative Ig domain-containing protein [Azospirillaceae bacterium]
DATAQTVTFSGLSISVADGASATYVVEGHYTGSGVTDGNTVKLSLAAAGVTSTGTAIASTQQAVTNGGGFTTDVTATKLVFTAEPAASVTSRVDFGTQPVVRATDALGNKDKDFTATVTLAASAGSLSGTASQAAAAGIATFSGLQHRATVDKQSFTLTASATGVTDGSSGTIVSDVVADRLSFTTQPAVSAMESGQAAVFSATPVVAAVDAGGITDQDWATGITLAVTAVGGGAAPGTLNSFTVTGDTDGSAATVTRSPSQGAAGYTGLGITYTAAGVTPDDIALRATSGALTAAESDPLEVSTQNTAPVLGSFGNSITFVEDGTPVAVNADALVSDTQTGSGAMPGGVLTIERQGGASAEDRFAASGTLSTLTEGGSFGVGGTTIGTVTTNSGGRLVLTFNGSATTALIQQALRQVTYANASDTPPASVTLALSLNDANPTDAGDPAYKGPGGAKTGTATTSVTVTAVNDAPVLTAPASATVNEDASVALSVSLDDKDAGTGQLRLEIASGQGTVSLGGTGAASLTRTGTLTELNAALAALKFTPTPDYAGPATVTVTVSDQGNSGSGGAKSASSAIAVTVTPINDQPSLQGGGTVTVAEDGGSVTLPAFSVSDADENEVLTATIALADPGAGRLSATTLSGTAAQLSTALSGLTFTPAKDWDRDTEVTVTVRDSGKDGTVPVEGTATVKVTPVNDAPTASGLGGTVTYREDGGPVSLSGLGVADVDRDDTLTVTLSLSDAAGGALSSTSISGTAAEVNAALADLSFTPSKDYNRDLTVSVDIRDKAGTQPISGSLLLKGEPVNDAPVLAAPDAVDYKQTDGTLAVQGLSVADVDEGEVLTVTLALSDPAAGSLSATSVTGTVAQVNAALAGLTFTPDKTYTLDSGIAVTVRDSGKDGVGPVTASVALDLTTVNTAPTASGLGGSTVFVEDGGPAALPSITVKDPDKGDVITVTLGLADGKAGTLSATTLSGTVDEVNAALSAVTFTPAKDYDRSTSVSVDIRDKEGKAPVTGTVELKATPVNDAVLLSGAGSTVTFGQSLGPVSLSGLSVADIDTDEQVTVTLTLSNPAAGTLSSGTLSGTVDQVNAALAGLTFTPNKDFRDDSTLTVDVRDGLENGTAPAAGTIALDVVPMPTAILLSGGETPENASGAMGGLTAEGADPQGRTWSLVSDPSGAFAIEGGTLVLTKSLDFEAVTQVALRVATRDALGQTLEQDLVVQVTNVNEAPTVAGSAGPLSAVAGQALAASLPAGLFADKDAGDQVAVTVSGPAWLAFDAATGSLSGTPGTGDVGTSTVVVTGTDKGGLSVSTSLSVTVTAPVVAPPVVTPPVVAPPVVAPPVTPPVVAPPVVTPPVVVTPAPAVPVGTPVMTAPTAPVATAPAPAPAAADAGTAAAATAGTGPGATAATPTAQAPTATTSTSIPVNAAASASGGRTGVVTVLPSAGGAPQPAALMLANPPPDQAAKAGSLSSFQLPNGTFQHTNSEAIVSVTATMADGSPLPPWLTFDPQTGTFKGDPPPDAEGTLEIKVTAEDNDGRRAEAKFRLSVGEDVPAEDGQGQGGQGRDGQGPAGEPGRDAAPADGPGNPANEAPANDAPAEAPAETPQQPQVQPPAQPTGQRQSDAAPAGKPSLTDQLRAAGQDGPLSGGAALLASLLDALSLTQNDAA